MHITAVLIPVPDVSEPNDKEHNFLHTSGHVYCTHLRIELEWWNATALDIIIDQYCDGSVAYVYILK